MLWDVVFKFFVQNIFGGVLFNNGEAIYYSGELGALWYGSDFTQNGFNTSVAMIESPLLHRWTLNNIYMPLGNYLSLIATIITMVVIVVLCCLLIKKIYNMVAHVIA